MPKKRLVSKAHVNSKRLVAAKSPSSKAAGKRLTRPQPAAKAKAKPSKPAARKGKPARRATIRLPHETALARFLRYVRIDTQSKDDCEDVPSTKKQLDLQRLLARELLALGLEQVQLDSHGYVMARLRANLPKQHAAYGKVTRLGLIAHADTSPAASGAGVKPQVITYAGGDITLPKDPSVVIRTSENPDLAHEVGKTIVTADGTTLLGADDKAGIAIIMTALEKLQHDPARLHGDLCVCFTPDEEVGHGTKFFNLKRFLADVAYTLDGDAIGELNRETFSANSATIVVHGRNIHPGKAKNIMVNATRVMADIIARMPKEMAPETTDGYQPYIHPHHLEAEEAKATLRILLRDFRTAGLLEQENILRGIIAEVQPFYPKARIELLVQESYRNMRDKLEERPEVSTTLEEAVRRAGVTPHWAPIRGGTDGARLTEMGLPTPNIFTGGQNYHGLTEWLSVDGMDKAIATVLNLVDVWVERASAAG